MSQFIDLRLVTKDQFVALPGCTAGLWEKLVRCREMFPKADHLKFAFSGYCEGHSVPETTQSGFVFSNDIERLRNEKESLDMELGNGETDSVPHEKEVLKPQLVQGFKRKFKKGDCWLSFKYFFVSAVSMASPEAQVLTLRNSVEGVVREYLEAGIQACHRMAVELDWCLTFLQERFHHEGSSLATMSQSRDDLETGIRAGAVPIDDPRTGGLYVQKRDMHQLPVSGIPCGQLGLGDNLNEDSGIEVVTSSQVISKEIAPELEELCTSSEVAGMGISSCVKVELGSEMEKEEISDLSCIDMPDMCIYTEEEVPPGILGLDNHALPPDILIHGQQNTSSSLLKDVQFTLPLASCSSQGQHANVTSSVSSEYLDAVPGIFLSVDSYWSQCISKCDLSIGKMDGGYSWIPLGLWNLGRGEIRPVICRQVMGTTSIWPGLLNFAPTDIPSVLLQTRDTSGMPQVFINSDYGFGENRYASALLNEKSLLKLSNCLRKKSIVELKLNDSDWGFWENRSVTSFEFSGLGNYQELLIGSSTHLPLDILAANQHLRVQPDICNFTFLSPDGLWLDENLPKPIFQDLILEGVSMSSHVCCNFLPDMDESIPPDIALTFWIFSLVMQTNGRGEILLAERMG